MCRFPIGNEGELTAAVIPAPIAFFFFLSCFGDIVEGIDLMNFFETFQVGCDIRQFPPIKSKFKL